MNVVLKLEGFISWEHMWLKEWDQFFMAHPVSIKVIEISLFQSTFKQKPWQQLLQKLKTPQNAGNLGMSKFTIL